MLSKFSSSRNLSENIQLGSLTAFTAGMVNVASFMIFFSFSSNVTGYYALLAAEFVKENWYQVAVVFAWIFLFFFGGFCSNLIVINFNSKNTYLAHATPLLIEILCLVAVGFYGEYFYTETLNETELLLALNIFAMGLQNGLTVSISNFTVKTTHLTGATTDVGVLLSLFTKKKFRGNTELRNRAKLLSFVIFAYCVGAILSAYLYIYFEFKTFYFISFFLLLVIVYDFNKLKIKRAISKK